MCLPYPEFHIERVSPRSKTSHNQLKEKTEEKKISNFNTTLDVKVNRYPHTHRVNGDGGCRVRLHTERERQGTVDNGCTVVLLTIHFSHLPPIKKKKFKKNQQKNFYLSHTHTHTSHPSATSVSVATTWHATDKCNKA